MLCSRLLGVMVILLGRTARLAGYGENRCLFRLPAERPQKEQIPTGGNMSASQPNSEDDERFKKFYLFFVEFVYLRPPESLRFCSALLSPAAKSIPANHLRPLFEYSYGSGEKPNPKLLTMYFSYVNDWTGRRWKNTCSIRSKRRCRRCVWRKAPRNKGQSKLMI